MNTIDKTTLTCIISILQALLIGLIGLIFGLAIGDYIYITDIGITDFNYWYIIFIISFMLVILFIIIVIFNKIRSKLWK